MALDLNNVVAPYQEFYGRVVGTMPNLVDGRVPASVSDVMAQRLHSGKQDWKDNYFFVGDAIAYHPDGKFKIVLDSESLRGLNSQSTLSFGALVLEDGAYETLKGVEFKRNELSSQLNIDLTADEAKVHPVWKVVARDQDLLNAYIDTMYPEMKQRFGQGNTNYDNNMGFYVEDGEKRPTLRALVVRRLGSRSQLYGRYDLDGDYGRLVGVAPEALSAPNKAIVRPSLETALAVVNQNLSKSGLKLTR